MDKRGLVVVGGLIVVIVIVLSNIGDLGFSPSERVLSKISIGHDLTDQEARSLLRDIQTGRVDIEGFVEAQGGGAASGLDSCSAFPEGELSGDGKVSVPDLIFVILDWHCTPSLGDCENPEADVTGDDYVDTQDMTAIILNWGFLCQCIDGEDNDGDGLIDFPNDVGCESVEDNDEFDGVPKGFIAVCDGDRETITLDEVRNNVNFDAHYMQICDIDLTGIEFEPIGDSSNEFRGIYDGGGYDIVGFSFVDESKDGVGLFGEIAAGAIVRNVNLVDVYVVGNEQVGGLIGKVDLNAALVENVHVSGSITGNEMVGGIAGELVRGHIKNSSANVQVTGGVGGGTTFSRVGGLVGSIGGGLVGIHPYTIENSHSSGQVNGIGAIGGLVGEALAQSGDDITIHNSYSTANVFAGNGFNVGGIVGYMYRTVISDSYSNGEVIGEGCSSMGGIAGVVVIEGSIIRSYSTGLVKGKSDVGGVVGRTNNVNNVVIEQSFATGEVRGRFSRTGGLVGHAAENTEIIDSYTQNLLVGCILPVGTCDETGGLVGQIEQNVVVENSYSATPFDLHQFSTNFGGFAGQEISNEISGSFWDLEVSEMEEGCGVGNCEGITGLATQEMQMESSFEGWDFSTVWGINEGESYPYLLWQEV